MRQATRELAKGKWPALLAQLGVASSVLTGKHGPCPGCGGTDRFRFTDHEASGAYICNQCGGGDGFDLLCMVHGWGFSEAAKQVDTIVGDVKPSKVRAALPDAKRVELLNDLFKRSEQLVAGDLVSQYLRARGCDWLPDDLMFCRRERSPNGQGYHPAMVAMVRGADGEPCQLHRTFIGKGAKADIDQPRALMPGPLPEGAAVRLSPMAETMGIATGIETALRAQKRFGVPVWATLNDVQLVKWRAPEAVKRLLVFGDNDAKFGGQAAAYECAHRNAVKGVEVEVEIPAAKGTDWADAA